MDRVRRQLDALAVANGGSIPSLSVAVRVAGRLELAHTVGHARLDPRRPAAPRQVYDLASLTKPLGAVTALAALIERGALGVDDPAARYAPGVDPRITVRHLLAHTSGLPPFRPLYAERDGRAAIVAEACRTPVQTEPGAAHAYSDLGFIALTAVIEAVGGAPLDVQLAPRLAELGVDLRWGWPGAAATEDSAARGGVIEGVVHDPNAFAMGGVSGHAGLFGAATDVALLAEALIEDPTAARLRGSADDRKLGHRGGWDTVSGLSSAGRWWPRDGVGHLGYTGTSVWTSPRDRVVAVLLTNRIHPRDDLAAIRAARPAVYEAISATLGWSAG